MRSDRRKLGGATVKVVGAIVVLLVAGVAYLVRTGGTGLSSGAIEQANGASDRQTASRPTTSQPAADKKQTPQKDPIAAKQPDRVSEVRIGSWNIEWLGKPEDRSGAGKDVAQSPEDLADCIIASKVAVLGVCEIVTRVAAGAGKPLRSREIEAALEAVKKRTGSKWEYVLYPGRADGDQLTGVLWDTSAVTAVRTDGSAWDAQKDAPWGLTIPKQCSAQGSYLWNRPPHAMKFSCGRGKTDFVMIVVHMKADYNGEFAAHREEEAKALAAALPEVRKRFKDQDVIIVGDTNCTGEHEAAVVVLEKMGFVDLNASHKATHWRGGGMDRAFVPGDQPEFRDRRFEVMSDSYLRERKIDAREYKRRYSDHYLVSGTMTVGEDDD